MLDMSRRYLVVFILEDSLVGTAAACACACCNRYMLAAVPQADLVPRSCVASLAALRLELDAAAHSACEDSAALAWMRDSGLLKGGAALAAGLGSRAASSMVRTA